MPLYDHNNPMCDEASTLYETGQWLAELEAAHSLAEATGTDEEKKAATLTHLIIGPHLGPWDGNQFTKDEHAVRFIEFQLYSPVEAGKVVIATGSPGYVDAQGEFILTTRMYCRPAAMTDRQDLYLFFLDRIAALEHQLMDWVGNRSGPALNSITREQGPAWGQIAETPAQGEYLFVQHRITWGNLLAEE